MNMVPHSCPSHSAAPFSTVKQRGENKSVAGGEDIFIISSVRSELRFITDYFYSL